MKTLTVKNYAKCKLFDLWMDKETALNDNCSYEYYKTCNLFIEIGMFTLDEIENLEYEWRNRK